MNEGMGDRVRGRWRTLLPALVAAFLVVAGPAGISAKAAKVDADKTWLVAWVGPHLVQDDAKPFALSTFRTATVQEQTIRQVVQPNIEGSQLRIRLSNVLGTSMVSIGRASVAKTLGSGPSLRPGTARELRFGGETAVQLWPGEDVLSDPVPLAVAAAEHIAIDLYVHAAAGPYSGHSMAANVAWVGAPLTGDQTGEPTGALLKIPGNSLAWIHSVDVFTTPRPVVVALGDSVTDAYVPEARVDWPSQLARSLGSSAGVVNSGMVANNVVTSRVCSECNPAMLTRLDHDALDLPGVTDLIVLGGFNDITQLTPVSRLEAAFTEIAQRAHARGIKVIVATLTPRQDWYQYYDAEVMSPMRHELNDWLRTADGFDAVVDFDAAIRDPMYEDRMWPPYDSGDRMHPGPLGMQKLAATIDPGLVISR